MNAPYDRFDYLYDVEVVEAALEIIEGQEALRAFRRALAYALASLGMDDE